MATIELRTSATQSSMYSMNGIMIPFSWAIYDIDKLFNQALINIYHGINIGALEISPNSPNGLNDVYEAIRLNTPNTEIILTQDPYDALGNIVRFLNTVDDSIGRDGDILISTLDYKMYKRENGIYEFKFQMQGGGSGSVIAAQWRYSPIVNNSLGVDGDMLITSNANVYKKINGSYVYQLNIAGTSGANGLDGVNGTKIHISNGGTYTGSSVDGDLNIVDATSLYQRINNVWVLEGSLKGDKGLKGDIGQSGYIPEIYILSTFTNTIGQNNDILFNPTTYEFYKKNNGAWTLKGQFVVPPPNSWLFNPTVDNSLGVNGDFLLTTTGAVYRKESGSWILKTNIKGDKGDKGDTGNNGTDGSKIYFNPTIDNTIGKNGDILFVENSIYQKVSGSYILTSEIGGTGNGYIEWVNIKNLNMTNINDTYTKIPLEIKSANDNTSITLSNNNINFPIGIYRYSLNIINKESCSFTILLKLGNDILLEKIIYNKTFSFSASFISNTTEEISIHIKSNKTFNTTYPFLSFDLSKISEIQSGQQKDYDSYIDTTKDCLRKNRLYINVNTETLTLDILNNPDIHIYDIILNSNSVITINNTSINSKKVLIYIKQSDIQNYNFIINNSNLIFTNPRDKELLNKGIKINEVLFLGLEFISSQNKWIVKSLTKSIFK